MKKPIVYKLSIGDIDIAVLTQGFYVIGDKSGSAPHSHAEFEYHFSVSGDAIVRFDDTKVVVNENHSLLICPQLFHKFLRTNNDSRVLSLAFSLKHGRHGTKYYDKLLVALNEKGYALLLPNTALTNLIYGTMAEVYSVKPFAKECMQARLTLLFSQIFSMITENGEENMQTFDTQEYDMRTYIIEEYFNEHFMENITLKDLANRMYLGEKQTERMIKKIYNAGFRMHLSTVRIKSSIDLITETTRSLSDIAAAVGYSSYYGFYNAFKKYTGMSPEEYRERK